MASSIKFDGINKHFLTPIEAPEDLFNGTQPMWGHTTGVLTYTRWRLTPEELEEVVRTGDIWLATRTGERSMLPTWVGTLSSIKRMCADFGGLWKPKHRKMIEDQSNAPEET